MNHVFVNRIVIGRESEMVQARRKHEGLLGDSPAGSRDLGTFTAPQILLVSLNIALGSERERKAALAVSAR